MAAVQFDVHPSVYLIQKWTAELPEKTGRSLEEWAELVKKSHFPVRKEQVEWLKKQHGLGTNTAIHIVNYATDQLTWDGRPEAYLIQAERYVEAIFSGKKAALRPIFDRVLHLARKLGQDVKVCPCKTIVPLYRNRVFAQLKPGTKNRLDLGLVLEEIPYDHLLQPNSRAAGNDRIQHIISLASVADLNADVLLWLKIAYDQDC